MLADSGAPVVATAERLLAAERLSSEGIFTNFVDTTEPLRLAQAGDALALARFCEIAAAYDPQQTFAAAGELPRISAT